MKNRHRFILLLIGTLILLPKLALAQMAVFDAASYGQLINQFNQMITEVSLMQEQATSLNIELKQLNAGQYQWSQAQGLINQLGGLVNQCNSLAYNAQNLGQKFQTQYPGYQPPTNFNQQYQQNVNTSMNTLNGILQSLGTNANDFTNENARLAFLQSQVQNSQGQMQAIQAASQISSEMVSQLQLLRQTMIAQTNAQAAYYAQQTQNDASNIAAQQAMFSAGNTSAPALGQSGESIHLVE